MATEQQLLKVMLDPGAQPGEVASAAAALRRTTGLDRDALVAKYSAPVKTPADRSRPGKAELRAQMQQLSAHIQHLNVYIAHQKMRSANALAGAVAEKAALEAQVAQLKAAAAEQAIQRSKISPKIIRIIAILTQIPWLRIGIVFWIFWKLTH